MISSLMGPSPRGRDIAMLLMTSEAQQLRRKRMTAVKSKNNGREGAEAHACVLVEYPVSLTRWRAGCLTGKLWVLGVRGEPDRRRT